MLQITIGQITNGWIIHCNKTDPATGKTETTGLIYASDTFDVFRILKSMLPLQEIKMEKK